MTTANNSLFWNSAFNGFLAGALAGGPVAPGASVTPAAYAAICTQAQQFAIEMDSQIANDLAATPVPAGTTQTHIAGGASIYPSGSTGVQESQALKRETLFGLSFGYAFQRYQTGKLAAAFAGDCAVLAAIWSEAVTFGVTT